MNIKDITVRLTALKLRDYRDEIIGAGIALLIGVAFYQFVYSRNAASVKRLETRASEVQAEIERVSKELQETQQIMERLMDALARLQDMEEQFVVTRSRIPADKQLSSIMKNLVDGEPKKEDKFTSFRPLPVEAKGDYFKLPLQITMQTRYQSFGEYLEKIEQMPRLITVENFRLDSKGDGQPALSAQIFMSAYILGGTQ